MIELREEVSDFKGWVLMHCSYPMSSGTNFAMAWGCPKPYKMECEMIVRECMTRHVELGTPEMSLRDAALKMRDGDFGILPIRKNDKLVGMITDRDIAIRCVAEGADSKKLKVGEVMTEKVFYCFEDQSLDEVAQSLGDNQVRRLPVVNREKKLVGILALSDLSRAHLNPQQLERTMTKLSKH